MNRRTIIIVMAIGGMCSLAAPSYACTYPPDVYIWDWLHYVGLGDSVTIEADESSGTYIWSWYWWSSPSTGLTNHGGTDWYGSCPSSSRTFSFSSAGEYQIWAEAENDDYLTDSDYARVYAVEVASVKEYLSDSDAIYVPVGGTAYLQAQPNPSVSWPSGQPTWTASGGGSIQSCSDGAAVLTGLDDWGAYFPFAKCGPSDTGKSLIVLAFQVDITTPSGGSGSTTVGSPLSLNCDPLPDISGDYAWSVTPSTGASVSPATVKNPTFTASQSGTYTVRVEYSKDYGGLMTAIANDEATITVADPSVEITSPLTFPQYTAVGSPLSFTCQTTGAGGGTITWTARLLPSGSYTSSGFSDPAGTTTSFTPSQFGDYDVMVEYTEGGTTAYDTGSVTAVAVDITNPSTFPAYVAPGDPVQLNCTPSAAGGTYGWSLEYASGPASFSDPHAQNPIFTATESGVYVVSITYTVGGVTVSDMDGPIAVVDVNIATPAVFPAYIAVGSPLQLDCVPGILGGTYSWSLEYAPGLASFSDPYAQNPTLTAMDAGAYVVKVDYTVGGVTVSDTAGPIGVVDVNITTPATFPAYVGTGDPLQLNSFASVLGGAYQWSQAAGPNSVTFSDPNVKNPTFTASQFGTYAVKVSYTVGSATVEDTSGAIAVVEVDLSWNPLYARGDGWRQVIVTAKHPPIADGAWTIKAISGYDPAKIEIGYDYTGYYCRLSLVQVGEEFAYTWPTGAAPPACLYIRFGPGAQILEDLVLRLSYSVDGITEVVASEARVPRPVTICSIANPEETPLLVKFEEVYYTSYEELDRSLCYRGFRLDYDAASSKWIGTGTNGNTIEASCTSAGSIFVRAMGADGGVFDSGEDQACRELPQEVENENGTSDMGGACIVALWEVRQWDPLAHYRPGDTVEGSSCDGYTELYTCMVEHDAVAPTDLSTNSNWYLGYPAVEYFSDQWDVSLDVGGPPTRCAIRGYILANPSCIYHEDYFGNDLETRPQGTLRMTVLQGADSVRLWRGEVGTGELLVGAGAPQSREWSLPDLFADVELPEEDPYWWDMADTDLGSESDTGLGKLYLEAVAPGPASICVEMEHGGVRRKFFDINAGLQFEVHGPDEISADDRSVVLVAGAFFEDGSPVEDGSVVEWFVSGDDGVLSASHTLTRDGCAAVTLSMGTTAGESCVMVACLTSIVTGGVRRACSYYPVSCGIHIVPGEPVSANSEIVKNKGGYAADEKNQAIVTATFRDQFNNPVAEGMPVAWRLSGSGTILDQSTQTDYRGIATATVQPGFLPQNQTVIAQAGNAELSVIVNVYPINSILTSTKTSLDVAVGETATLTATFTDSSGHPVTWATSVTWYASNGYINGQTTYIDYTANGISSVTLSSAGARVENIWVSAAAAGSPGQYMEIPVTCSAPTYLVVEHDVIVGDETTDGTFAVETLDGSAAIPYYASTKVDIYGSPGAVATCGISGAFQPVASYPMDAIEGGTFRDSVGSNHATIHNVVLDTTHYAEGSASAHFDGSDDWLELSDDDTLHISDGLRIQLWIRPEVLGSATLIGKSGEYQIGLDDTGHLTFTVDAAGALYTVTSAGIVQAGQWHWVHAVMSDGVLSLSVDASESTVPYSGEITPGTAPILVGSSFQGNIDHLVISRFQTGSSSLVTLSGVDADNKVVLDANGRAVVWLNSTGSFDPGLYGEETEVYVSASPSHTQKITILCKKYFAHQKNVVAGFVWGGGSGPSAFAGDVAAGVLIWGDVRDLTIQGVRAAWPWAEADKATLAFATIGLGLELAPIAGEPADASVGAAKTLVKRLGSGAFRQGFVEVILKTWKSEGASAAMKLIWDNGDFIIHVAGASDNVVDGLKVACKNGPEFTQQAFRIHKTLGSQATDLVADIARRADLGDEVASKVAKVLGESSDEVLAALKQGDELCTEAVEGLAKVLNHGIDPELTKKILANQNLLSDAYKQADLLKDMGTVADIPGFHKLTKMMQSSNSAVHGFRYELEIAAHHRRAGASITFISNHIDTIVGKTDVDLIIEGVYYQAKSTSGAFRSLDTTKAWVAKAMADMGGSASYSRIKYVVPSAADVPDNILLWFRGVGIDIIPIPHL